MSYMRSIEEQCSGSGIGGNRRNALAAIGESADAEIARLRAVVERCDRLAKAWENEYRQMPACEVKAELRACWRELTAALEGKA